MNDGCNRREHKGNKAAEELPQRAGMWFVNGMAEGFPFLGIFRERERQPKWVALSPSRFLGHCCSTLAHDWFQGQAMIPYCWAKVLERALGMNFLFGSSRYSRPVLSL